MAVSNELTVQEREVIFEDMDKVTQEAATEGVEKVKAGYQAALLISYDLGALVNRVYEAEHLNETQRKQEIKKLAAYWNQPNMGPSTLYDLRNVAAAFDREFLLEQSKEKMSNGNFLTWSHFKELQKVNSEKRQLSILKKIRQHSWSANELALELQGKKEAETKRSGGRKPTLPKTPNGMLQKLFTSIQSADNYVTAVSEPLGGLFLEMPPSEVDEQFVDNIDNTLARIEETAEHLKETEKKLKKVRTRATTVLKKAESADAEETNVAMAAKESPEGDRSTGKKRVRKSPKKKVTSAKKKAPTKRAKKKVKRKAPRRSGNPVPAEADAIIND